MGRTIVVGPGAHGRRELQKLAKDLEQLGVKLEPEIAKEIRKSVVPLIRRDVKASAAATLPKRGGLAARAAKTVRTTATGSTRRGDVRIRTNSKSFDVGRTDAGVVRHPLFGNREVWIDQPIRPGWWSKPVEAHKPDVMKATDEAVKQLIKRLDLD